MLLKNATEFAEGHSKMNKATLMKILVTVEAINSTLNK